MKPFRRVRTSVLVGDRTVLAPHRASDPALRLQNTLPLLRHYDVVVIGGGNAALCAALEARRLARHVLLVEKAPPEFRGGNSQHTRDIRYAHAADQYTTGPYDEAEFLDDILRVTGGLGNRSLTDLTIHESRTIPHWMEQQGVRWQAAIKGTLHLTRTNVFYLGGGKALINTYYRAAEEAGIEILYDTAATDIEIAGGRAASVDLTIRGSSTRVRTRSVVVASGGFEANIPWLEEYWGPAAKNYIVRGVSYNDGVVLAALYRRGAQPVGDPKGFHAVAVDARSPRHNGGIVTRMDTVPFGIVVNQQGERFYDEGEDLWPKRYAIWGRLIADQPDQIAYSIVDAKTFNLFMPPVYKPLVADSIEMLARLIDVDAQRLRKTIDDFNAHIVTSEQFDPGVLDGRTTAGLHPPKSHWALPIDTPPFHVYPLRPGITFTYRGVTVDEEARVLMNDGRPFENIYAAGEIMAGNILARGYLAGVGLTIGTVFGRIAGNGAGRHAAD